MDITDFVVTIILAASAAALIVAWGYTTKKGK